MLFPTSRTSFICSDFDDRMIQGIAVKFRQPENKMSCSRVDQKSSGVGCSGVEIPCYGIENGGE